jgi:hypothetical protein
VNLPSVKTLRAVFDDNAREARRVLEMTRSQLLDTEAGDAIARRCYGEPRTSDIRLAILDRLAGTSGVEGFRLRDGSWVLYLNAGDTYTTTLVRMPGGRYRVTDWGTIAERYGTMD